MREPEQFGHRTVLRQCFVAHFAVRADAAEHTILVSSGERPRLVATSQPHRPGQQPGQYLLWLDRRGHRFQRLAQHVREVTLAWAVCTEIQGAGTVKKERRI